LSREIDTAPFLDFFRGLPEKDSGKLTGVRVGVAPFDYSVASTHRRVGDSFLNLFPVRIKTFFDLDLENDQRKRRPQ
jgi:hypothetical protein